MCRADAIQPGRLREGPGRPHEEGTDLIRGQASDHPISHWKYVIIGGVVREEFKSY